MPLIDVDPPFHFALKTICSINQLEFSMSSNPDSKNCFHYQN